MTDTTDHAAWDRIAPLRPRLRAHTQIIRHHYRGQPWYVLQNRVSTQFYRFSTEAHRFIRLMDGKRTIQAIWDEIGAEQEDPSLTREGIVHMMAQLHAADMLQTNLPADVNELYERRKRQRRRKWQSRLMRPLAQRFRLLDPERFRTAALPLVRPAFGRLGLFIWLLVVAAGLLLGITHWPELAAHWSSRALDPRNLLLMVLIFPIVKGLHELGHAFATKVWNGEVHEMGIMLLVLMPIPYVDASAANAFVGKRKRIMVGAAGIMVEVFLSALAMFLWLTVQPGLVRDIAFDVMLIGGVSTLLFNGNPLLRFDGYYILADAIEIPNLGPRSTRYLGYLVKRYLFGLQDVQSPVTAPGERGWFVVYGVASMLYRLVISFVIALFVATQLFLVGVVLALWALTVQIVYPAGKHLGFLLFNPKLRGRRLRPLTVSALLALTTIAFVFGVPVPSWTRAEGVIRLPEQSLVRAGTEGFIVSLLGANGQKVIKGDPLFVLQDPVLSTRVSILEWNLRELEARLAADLFKDRVQAEIFKDEIAEVQAELHEARARRDRLTIRSPASGTLTVPRARDLEGRFVRQGDLLAYVADLSTVTARVVVPQTAVDLVRRRTRDVEARLASRPADTIKASIAGDIPSATDQLPSRVLGTQGGGAIAVDARDTEGVRAIDRVFQFDIALPADTPQGYAGTRVYVRFSHGKEPLARQWYRALRQLFLARLQV
jgi:putative peptide zinc metalloprotease protein